MPLVRRLSRFPRTRSALRAIQTLVVIMALSIGGTGAFLVTQGSRVTEVSEDALLAEFRSAAEPETDTASGPATESAEPSAAAVEPDATPAPSEDVSDAGQGSVEAAPEDSSSQPDPAPSQTASPDPTAAASTPAPGPSPEPATPTFGLPEEGVYTYDTEGYEKVSMAGGRHDYPEQTYASLRRTGGCGWETDHRFLEEHREVKQWCSDGVQLGSTGFSSYITFFGQETQTHGTCDPAQIVARHDAEVGDSYTSHCSGDGWTSTAVATFRGREVLTVGGTAVEALHFTQVTTLEGDTRGRSDQEAWYHPETGLPLKIVRETTTHANAFGGEVEYNEQVTLVLTSLTPRR